MLTQPDSDVGPDLEPDEDDDTNAGGKTAGEPRLRYTDADFLKLVADERERSIGFGDGDSGQLLKTRVKSQEYRQGIVNDLKVIKGRSQAVDSTLSDAVDTVMPDLMEVFFGGDDVVTFDADGEADEAEARQETDVVSQVVFGQNDAFVAFNDAFLDGLVNRTAIFTWSWEEKPRSLGTQTAADPIEATVLGAMFQEQKPWTNVTSTPAEDGSVELEFLEKRGRCVFKAVASEDFSTATDTVRLRDATYNAMRDRPRVQDLIERGVDPVKARALPRYSVRATEMDQVRSEAGESDRSGEENALDDLRQVEIRAHYLKIDADDDGVPEIWRIETDAEEKVLLQKECVSHMPFAGGSPFRVAHRFYGEGLFDKLAEVMRIKTVLLRMLLDSGYFALNQRYEVSENSANEFTIADLLNNAPNVPVRSKDGNAVRALTAGQLGFEVMGALEYMATVGETRSGVVRNAQGLNPDTLHDTAAGAMALIQAAQKRVRFIVRVLAETVVKDLFLGVHQTLREQQDRGYRPINHKAGQAWSQIWPADWAERDGLTVHVGVGSSNRQHELEVQTEGAAMTEKVIAMQGGQVNGPFVTPQNVYARLKAFSRAMGEKSPELYWSDPGEGAIQPAGGQQGPSPEMAKAQGEAQVALAKHQAETAAAAQAAQVQQQLDQQRLAGELEIQREQMRGKLALDREKAVQAIQLQREEMLATIQLKREQLVNQVARSTAVANDVEALPGGIG